MADNMTSADFSRFLTEMAQKTSSVTALDSLRVEIEQKKQQEVKEKILHFYNRIQSEVTELRRIRKMEKATQARITKLEQQCQQILDGTYENNDEDETL